MGAVFAVCPQRGGPRFNLPPRTNPMKNADIKPIKLRDPWLVAAWPGMGGVATLAGTFLAESLRPEHVGRIPEGEFFAVDHVDVNDGIARTGALPRSMFFAWRDPDGRRDLLIFLGEAQPAQRGFDLCRRVVDVAVRLGVKRIVTFASMAANVHPAAEPRVLGAVTVPDLLGELRDFGIDPLKEGHVGGLNGALLAAAAQRNLPAVCLLGEFPAFAINVPNPKAALAVLGSFCDLSGIDLDLSELDGRARQSEDQLTELLARLQDRTQESGDEPADPPAADKPERDETAVLDEETRRRIERLFNAASHDRGRAPELKNELDRLGVFEQYEDRFLDLFRRAG